MGRLNKENREFLFDNFGSRVNFFRRERRLYGHDMAEMPRLIKPLLGDTTPEAVVQPKNEGELVELVKWAVKQRIPLT